MAEDLERIEDEMAEDEERAARLAEIEQRKARQRELIERYGMPVPIAGPDALAKAFLARVEYDVTALASDVFASIYRDAEAADAWLAANLEHNGHPALARVPLPDGRVIGILDLRPAVSRAAGTTDRDA